MPGATLRRQARTDIFEIWSFIADDSIAAADRWMADLHERLALWSTQPNLGRSRDDVAPGLRSLALGRYVVFYEPLEDGIDVVRVLHGSRDIDQAFGH